MTIFLHGFSSLFIVKGERFTSDFGESLHFLLQFPSPSPAPFFTAILTGTKQLIDFGLNNGKLQKKFYSFTYFFQLLGSNIRFLKIQKSTLTIDLFSEFSCKSRFVKVGFAITTYLSKPNITFCFWDRATEFFGS